MESSIHNILDQFTSLALPAPFWEEYPESLIYGAGNMGKDVFNVLTGHNIPVIGFLDQKGRPRDCWNGVPIYQPDEEFIPSDKRELVNVIIAVHNRDAYIPPIIEKLKNTGFSKIITLIELYDYFGQDLGNRYWLTSRSWYRSFEKEIGDCLGLWADEKSREIFLNTLSFRLTGNYSMCPHPEEVNCQYAPFDIPNYELPLRFVDCGAFDGDTLESFLDAGIPLQSVAAFEPDQANFNKLAQFVQINSDRIPNACLWPCGVYSSVMQAKFEAGLGEAAKLSTEGNTIVQCVSLDEAIPNFAPNLIKMDIEGAEYMAILGGQRIIQTCRPSLAICVYHEPEHLWQIPLLIRNLCGNNGGGTITISGHIASMGLSRSSMLFQAKASYDFYLRQHGNNGFDLVMYAVPTSNRA